LAVFTILITKNTNIAAQLKRNYPLILSLLTISLKTANVGRSMEYCIFIKNCPLVYVGVWINILNYLTLRHMNNYKLLIASCCKPACCLLA